MSIIVPSAPFNSVRKIALSSYLSAALLSKYLHTSPRIAANPLPVTTAGPPPSAPIPAASQYGERVDRRRRQAEMLQRGQEFRTGKGKPGNAMKKRFWKDVTVQTNPGRILCVSPG